MTGVTLSAIVHRTQTGEFSYWELSGSNATNCQSPATCTVTIAQGNKADFAISISDPQGPSSGPKQVTFAASPIFATPAAKAEIDAKSVAGQNLTTLTFTDHNWDKDTLSVVLKFNNAPPMDPIIQNGGGGPPRGSNNFLPTSAGAFAVDLAIALAIGVVIGLMLRRLAK